jgi:hypothetical protein
MMLHSYSSGNTAGDSAMLRKLLLPFLATAVLAGCATDYSYRGGNGDYYYGQPRVEYRYQDIGGYYGDSGYGFGGGYYYDRFGRLVYGVPGGYYGSPYYGDNGWYRPRPHRDHGDRDDHDDHEDNEANAENQHRPPPWRDLGRLQNRTEIGSRSHDDRERPTRIERPMRSVDGPFGPQRAEPGAPVMRQRSESSSRMGGFIGGAVRARDKGKLPPQE